MPMRCFRCKRNKGIVGQRVSCPTRFKQKNFCMGSVGSGFFEINDFKALGVQVASQTLRF